MTDPIRTLNMAQVSGTIELAEGYFVTLPDTDHLIVVAGAVHPSGACAFDHPNVSGRSSTIFQTRAYWPSGFKKWFSHAGVYFYFAIPRDRVELVRNVKGYSYVPVVLGGQPYRFSVSGGTDGRGWHDHLRTVAHVGIGFTIRKLKGLAELALAPAEALRRGISYSLTEMGPDERSRYVEKVAGYHARSSLKAGDAIWLAARCTYSGRTGPFTLEAGAGKRRSYVCGDGAGGQFRARHPHIDWTRTAEVNGIPLTTPVAENRIGPIQPYVDPYAATA